jgi:4-amino-4-deoxy-L-arabinose transferase-like glycosyltransferase
MTSDPASDRLFVRLTWATVALGGLARLVRFAQPFPLWGDEVFVTQNFLDRDFRTILNQLDNGQICPPLFLWLQLAVFKLAGGGEQAMRLLPLFAGVLGMLGFARLAVRLLPAFPAFLAVGFLAVAIWPVSLSTFAKPYSFDLFAAVAVLTVAVHWRERPESTGRGFLFALVLPVAMLASYTTAFVAGGALLALLPAVWNAGWPSRLLFALGAAGLFAAFAFVLTVGKAQLDTPDVPIKDFLYDYWRHGFPPDEWWQTPLWLLQGFTGRMFAYPVGDGNGGSTLTFLMAVLGGRAWWKRYPRWQFVLLVVPVALNLVAAVLWKYPFGACGRLSQYAAPAICLFAGLGTATLLGLLLKSARAFRIIGWVYAVVFAGLAVGYIVSAIREPFHDPEAKWVRDTVQEFAGHLRPDDRVVMRVPDAPDVPIPRWHFRLIGDRVTWGGAWPVDSKAKRVFVVDYWQGPKAAPHTPPLLAVPPGWAVRDVTRKQFVWPEPEDQKLTLVFERHERSP